jgi:ABC-type Fe3+/spermidine/putrescine transport system ATPase subunit
VYVTHDQEEALLLSDRIGIMDGGRLLQVATPRELYERPATAFVADFVGSLDVIEGTVAEVRAAVAMVVPSASDGSPAADRVLVPAGDVASGAHVRVAVRPERISLTPIGHEGHPGDGGRGSSLRAQVERVIYLGNLTRIDLVTASGQRLTSEHISDEHLAGLTEGTAVAVTWPLEAGFILPSQD